MEELWDSIAADQGALPLTDDQRKLLDKRLDACEMDGDPGRPADVAIADIRALVTLPLRVRPEAEADIEEPAA